MKIKDVKFNNRKNSFTIKLTGNKSYSFPYSELSIKPSRNNPVVKVSIDKEVGSEAFTYQLADNSMDTLLAEQVLSFNNDPDILLKETLYKLTIELQKALNKSEISKRQLAKLLGTSQSQLDRLLDQTNYKKSANHLIRALGFLSKNIELKAA